MKKYMTLLLALLFLMPLSSIPASAEEAIGTYTPPAMTGLGIRPQEISLMSLNNEARVKQHILNALRRGESVITFQDGDDYLLSCTWTAAEEEQAKAEAAATGATGEELKKEEQQKISEMIGKKTQPMFNDVFYLYCTVLDENPDLFYAFMGMNGGNYVFDTRNRVCYLKEVQFTLLDGAYAMRDIFNLRIDNIIKQTIREDMTDEQKAFALHEYLIANTTYGYLVEKGEAYPQKYPDNHELIAVTGPSDAMTVAFDKTKPEDRTPLQKSIYQKMLRGHTACGAILDNVGVCQSYTLAYKILCNRAGIENIPIYSTQLGHMWNLVKLDGNWYHVDVTYDDPVYSNDLGDNDNVQTIFGASHKNFLVSDATIQKNHEAQKTDANGNTFTVDGSDAYVYSGTLPVCSDKSREPSDALTKIDGALHYDNDDNCFYYQQIYKQNNASGTTYFPKYYKVNADYENNVEVDQETYTAAINAAATAPFTAAGSATRAQMFASSDTPLTSVHLQDLSAVGFQIDSTEDVSAINVWIGFYDASGTLINCTLRKAALSGGTGVIALDDLEIHPNALQARVFFWDGDKNPLRPLTKEFLRIA